MSEEVLFDRRGEIGLITLNRPRSLNALTLPMIMEIQKQLVDWKDDPHVKAIVMSAASGAAFCAGGDVRWLFHAGQSHSEEQMQFFWHEYRLNHFIHHIEKPYIALMDGITMGGGVGISLHGSHPVASERFVFAMPETSIGFFPDIGASYLLNRCPGHLGLYLGLTGNRLGVFDSVKAGLVQHVVASEQMHELIDALSKESFKNDVHAQVNYCISQFSKKANDDSSLISPSLDKYFAYSTIESIKEALDESVEPWAREASMVLDQKCPLSLKVTLAQLRKSKGLVLAECLKMDYVLVQHFMKGTDFYEGVRALLIDKDKLPHWRPATLELVSDETVVNYFEQANHDLEFIM